MAKKKRWSELSVRTRRTIVVAGAIETVLKVLALWDLKRRPSSEVRGPKAAWAVGVGLANSAGVVPLVYFAFGRRAGGRVSRAV